MRSMPRSVGLKKILQYYFALVCISKTSFTKKTIISFVDNTHQEIKQMSHVKITDGSFYGPYVTQQHCPSP